uniref:Uncharacterized protein n=1 Tax=Rhizophora mucronata TaxID=61149 RepID=A0A2P2QEG4_RHIMU
MRTEVTISFFLYGRVPKFIYKVRSPMGDSTLPKFNFYECSIEFPPPKASASFVLLVNVHFHILTASPGL